MDARGAAAGRLLDPLLDLGTAQAFRRPLADVFGAGQSLALR